MKKWIEKNKNFFKSKRFMAITFGLLVLVLLGVFFGIKVYGYLMAVTMFGLFFYFAKQAEKEQIISPKEIEEMEHALAELREELAFIDEHLAENPSDLDAKLLKRELHKKIALVEEEMPKQQ